MAQHLIVDTAEPFLRITLNRPRKGNLVTPRMMLELPAALGRVGPRHKAVVLRGAGADFCLGREPKPIPGGRTDTAFNAHAAVMGPILAVYRAARECPVPIVAAVQGHALGFGSGLVGVCDVALADADARFALPEMDKGIPPTLVMCALADVSRKALVEMVYSCEAMDASTALAIGLVSRVAPAGGLDAALEALLARLRGYDVAQVRTVKGFAGKPGHVDPATLSDLAGYTLATAFTRPRR
jgi:enoyl-CoA hydratase/carnithine racemase